MKAKIVAVMTIVTSVFLMSCGTVREHRLIVQPLKKQLTASVGSTLFRLNRRGDLPNAFGGRDIYGGKVDKGYAEVKLRGIRENKYLDLIVFDVSRDSTETTMDRYKPFDKSLVRVNVSQTVNINDDAGNQGLLVTVDTSLEKEFILAGVRISFLEIRPSSVVYTLEDLESGKK